MTLSQHHVGRWLACLWNVDAGQGRIHPEDVADLPKGWIGGRVARCISLEDEYLTLHDGLTTIRIVPWSTTLLEIAPRYVCGDKVTVDGGGNHSPHTDHVETVGWHFKNATYFYLLKGRSSRYSERDLSPGDP